MYDHRRWDLSHWLGFDTLCMYDTVNTLASRGYIECCGVTSCRQRHCCNYAPRCRVPVRQVPASKYYTWCNGVYVLTVLAPIKRSLRSMSKVSRILCPSRRLQPPQPRNERTRAKTGKIPTNYTEPKPMGQGTRATRFLFPWQVRASLWNSEKMKFTLCRRQAGIELSCCPSSAAKIPTGTDQRPFC